MARAIKYASDEVWGEAQPLGVAVMIFPAGDDEDELIYEPIDAKTERSLSDGLGFRTMTEALKTGICQVRAEAVPAYVRASDACH